MALLNNLVDLARRDPFVPALPPIIRTRDGQTLNPNDIVWRLRKQGASGGMLTMDWSEFTQLSPTAIQVAKAVLSARASERASLTTRNDYQMLRRFDSWLPSSRFEWSDLTLALAETWLQHGLDSMGVAGNDFAMLRDLYRYGVTTLQHPHFSLDLLLKLTSVRAKGNAKGNAVRNGDPLKGYFWPDEVEDIVEAVREGKGTLEGRATTLLCLEVGRNVGQLVQVQNRGLTRVSATAPGEAPRWIYQIAIPRQKKRKAEVTTRTWPLSTTLGDMLWALRRGADDARLIWWVPADSAENSLTYRMQQWVRSADVRSARVNGDLLHVNARRFRTTLMTNAADEGGSHEHVAILGDHSDLQNSGVYLERSPLFLERIAAKVNALYDPLVRRFKGQMATAAATTAMGLPTIPGRATQLPTLALPGVGACGRKDLCGKAPPLVCYPCTSFIAWEDTDHRSVEAALVERMDTMDERIALQIAPSLAAVREVITEQDRRRGTAAGEATVDGGRV